MASTTGPSEREKGVAMRGAMSSRNMSQDCADEEGCQAFGMAASTPEKCAESRSEEEDRLREICVIQRVKKIAGVVCVRSSG